MQVAVATRSVYCCCPCLCPLPAACAAYAAVTIRGGSIVSVSETVPRHARYPVIDYGYAVISPGVIDVHVHMNEPGREDWEGEQGRGVKGHMIMTRGITQREMKASSGG